MAWLAVDKNETEVIFDGEPCRSVQGHEWVMGFVSTKNFIVVPKGTIKKILGRKLTWEDETVEIEQNFKFFLKEGRKKKKTTTSKA